MSAHLFILSGQSNMARFKPSLWFTPALSKALGEDRVIVSFYAKGGQPIPSGTRVGKAQTVRPTPKRAFSTIP